MRLGHGQYISLEEREKARQEIAKALESLGISSAAVPMTDLTRFDFMFPQLQEDDGNLLPVAAATVTALKRLGSSMRDKPAAPTDPPAEPNAGDSNIPALYTYFGQFVDHDITLDAVSDDILNNLSGNATGLASPSLQPMALEDIRAKLKNSRSATFDLDNVYGAPAPRDPANGEKMKVGNVSVLENNDQKPLRRPLRAAGNDANDLPRLPRNPSANVDRAAQIGDPRNDENTIVAQLHTAFLLAHNRFIDLGYNFDEARALLQQHYQFIVIEDFLKRIADETVIDDVLNNPARKRFFNLESGVFMPHEFSVAAYRLGHSMVRAAYNFNLNFNLEEIPATLGLLFTFSAFTGNFEPFPDPNVPFDQQGTDTLPENWIIEWERFVNGTTNFARALDTKMVEPLFELTEVTGQPIGNEVMRSLAVRNLLRGYVLRIPTGQAVANAIGTPALTADELKNIALSASPEQADALEQGGFLDRTPLWFYILAEAAQQGNGNNLGAVGSTIIAEVFIELARRSENSYLLIPGWQPTIPVAGDKLRLSDLLRFAGVLE